MAPPGRDRSDERSAGIARRLAGALASGNACGFVVDEAEALPGVRGALLLPPGQDAVGELGATGVFAVQIGEPPLAALAVLIDDAPTAELEHRLNEIASLAEPLLVNERRLVASHDDARRDPLTGLPNRRSLGECLEALGGKDVALIMCDLDNFKRVNDERGYRAGDETLKEVARILASDLRPGEQVFRIGGDEFCIVLEAGRDAAHALAGRLPESLLRRRRGPRLPTLSAGVAVAPAAVGAGELIARASEALAEERRNLRPERAVPQRPLAVLVVDDDPGLRTLLRTTFELADLDVLEAATAAEAREALAQRRPDAVVLDVMLPDIDGVTFTRELRSGPNPPGVVLLTGGDVDQATARQAGADALIKKPFSPLELLDRVRRVAGSHTRSRPLEAGSARPDDQLLLYATDLRRLLEVERRQRESLDRAHRDTLGALANALETRDLGTGAHSQRVQRYASRIAAAIEPALLDDPSVEYGFLLHDLGKIGIPDQILRKPGKLTAGERRVMQTHAPLGAHILAEVGLLHGDGLAVVRHHHERWDGNGYPDRLERNAIPVAARVFAVADTLDAITSDRPYRRARPWEAAVEEIRSQSGRQFDPEVVAGFIREQTQLRHIHEQLAA